MSGQVSIENLKKSVENFNKMLSEENSESIKISYWSLLEQQFKNFTEKNNSSNCVELIFQTILGKNFEVLKMKNLFYLIINFVRSTDYNSFIKYFFMFLNELIRNYNDTKTIFNEFMYDFSFSLMIEENVNSENKEIMKNYFLTFVDVDKHLFLFTMVKNINCGENLLGLFEKKNNFNFIFLEFFKKLAKSHQFEFLLQLLENLYSTLSKSVDINKNETLVGLISFFLKKIMKIDIKSIENFSFNIKQSLISIFVKIFQFLKLINTNLIEKLIVERYLLFILEFCLCKNIFVIELFDYVHDYLKFNFIIFNETLLLYIYIISNEIYEKTAFEKVLKILIFLVQLEDGNQSFLYKFIPKLLFKKFEQQNKFKQSENSQNIKLYEEFNKQHLIKVTSESFVTENDDSAIEFYQKYEKYQNISDLNLINLIVKKCFSNKKDNKEMLIINASDFSKYLTILFNLNLEKYNQNFKNFSLNFFTHLTLLFAYDHIEIIDIVISKMRNYQDKIFIKTYIYPLILTYLQTVYIDKFNENITNYSKINKLLFNLLIEYCREDSIANIIYKLLTKLYSLTLPNSSYINKDIALEIYNDFIIKKNSGKYVDIYYKFLNANLKKETNIEIKHINYKYLYKYCQNYEGSLLSELEQNLFQSFDKKLEVLYNFEGDTSDLDTLYTLSCVYEIICKDEPKNIIDKIFDYFTSNKFIKIINNYLKILEGFTCDELLKSLNIKSINFSESQDLHKVFSNEKNLTNKKLINLFIFRSLSQIYSSFLKNLIINNNEQFKDRKNYTTNNTIMQIFKNFDFLFGNIIFNSSSKESVAYVIYINEIFANYENLIFYYNTFCYYKAMNHVEENNLNLSLLNEINNRILLDNNQKLFDIFTFSSNFPILAKFIHNILKYETLFFEKKDLQECGNYVIEDINDAFWNTKNELKLENINNFSKLFIEKIFQIDEDYQDIHIFLVYENIILKYFKFHLNLLNPQFIVIITYNVLKQITSQNTEIKEIITKNTFSLLGILIKQNKGIFITLLRLFMNDVTFKNFCLEDQVPIELFSIIDFIIKQTIIYNSYKNSIMSHVLKLYDAIESFIYKVNCEDEIYIFNSKNYQNLLINSVNFINEKLKNDKPEVELNKKALETIQVSIYMRLTNLLNYLVSNRNTSFEKINNLFDYFEIINGINKFLSENKQQIILLNEITASNKKMINFMDNFNNSKDLSKLNLILCSILNEENKDDMKILKGYLVYFKTSISINKFDFDAIQTLIFNVDFANFGKKNKLLLISLLAIHFLIEKNISLSFLIKNFDKLEILSLILLQNISLKFDFDKTINFPRKNKLLN